MAKTSRTAIVLVDRDWYDAALRIVIGGQKSRSTVDVHVLTAPLVKEDHCGVWIGGVPRKLVTDGGGAEDVEEVEFMVPWRVILGLAFTREQRGSIGFRSRDVITD